MESMPPLVCRNGVDDGSWRMEEAMFTCVLPIVASRTGQEYESDIVSMQNIVSQQGFNSISMAPFSPRRRD